MALEMLSDDLLLTGYRFESFLTSQTSSNNSSGVATDSNSNVYISGVTQGSLGGASQGGFYDAWVAKYSQLN